MWFETYGLFLSHGGEVWTMQYKYILFNKITIKIYDINRTSVTHVKKQNWYG